MTLVSLVWAAFCLVMEICEGTNTVFPRYKKYEVKKQKIYSFWTLRAEVTATISNIIKLLLQEVKCTIHVKFLKTSNLQQSLMHSMLRLTSIHYFHLWIINNWIFTKCIVPFSAFSNNLLTHTHLHFLF